MKNHRLSIRAKDKSIFDDIASGKKIFDARAATVSNRKIELGDSLTFVCGDSQTTKIIKGVQHFSSIDEMFSKVSLKEVFPSLSDVEEAKKIYYGFPGYKEKIEKDGILAYKLE